jgi:hypothetical protein
MFFNPPHTISQLSLVIRLGKLKLYSYSFEPRIKSNFELEPKFSPNLKRQKTAFNRQAMSSSSNTIHYLVLKSII